MRLEKVADLPGRKNAKKVGGPRVTWHGAKNNEWRPDLPHDKLGRTCGKGTPITL